MDTRNKRIFVRSGHELLAQGSTVSGCRFFTAYPAPTTAGLCDAMVTASRRHPVLAMTAPDDATAAAYALGASARGVKAMLAVSAPAWSRVADAVQYAAGAELPLVVVVVEQLTPTWSDTQGAQADRLLVELSASGLSIVPVFTPSTPAECYALATTAFHWAERLRTPVIIRCDSEVVQLFEDIDETSLLAYDGGTPPATDGRAFRAVGGSLPARITAAPHGDDGRFAAEAAPQHERHLRDKITEHLDGLAAVQVLGDANADVVVFAFGAAARTARETVRLARERGRSLAAATVLSLLPVPAERLSAIARRARIVVVVEGNPFGHYRRLIEPALSQGRQIFGVEAVGCHTTPQTVLEAIEECDWKVEYV